MTVEPAYINPSQAGYSAAKRASVSSPGFWRTNYELLLAIICLVALLIGWIGGSVTGILPGWMVAIVAVIAFFAGGYVGVIATFQGLRHGKFDIDFLMTAAAFGAAAIGAWEEGALLLFLFTLSGALETFALDRTRNAIAALSELRPETALLWQEDADTQSETIVSVDALQVGDRILVRPGERLPMDGVILRGSSTLDQSPITGESVPVAKTEGDGVFAGTINGSNALVVEVTKLASESTLSRIIDLVGEAQEDAAPTQRFIDRFSQPYTLGVIGATILMFAAAYWLFSLPFHDALYRAMTLLVVASPCALVISTPASILSAIAAAARSGVLFKGGIYLEKVAQIDTLALDKTGTLTEGKPVVTDVRPFTQYSEDDVLRMAASAELASEHPLGRAIIDAAHARDLQIDAPSSFRSIAGHGIEATFETPREAGAEPMIEHIYIGNEKLFAEEHLKISPAIAMVGEALRRQGKTAMLVVRRSNAGDTLGAGSGPICQPPLDWEVVGFVAVADTLRKGAAATIEALHNVGVKRIAMLTGDHKAVARAIADAAGIDEVHADLLPEEKVALVRTMAQEGTVGMVGDGVNDAPALASASVGIAMGAGGTDVALETADVVLMASDLSKLPFTIELGHKAVRIVKQNVIFAVSVIVTLITLTVAVPLIVPNFLLPLPLGVVGHEGSTLLVVLNGLRMLGMRPRKV